MNPLLTIVAVAVCVFAATNPLARETPWLTSIMWACAAVNALLALKGPYVVSN